MLSVPKIVTFEALQLSHSRSVTRDDGQLITSSRLSLVLRADSDTNIVLEDGGRLEDVDVNLTVVDERDVSDESAEQLGSEGVGFLCQTNPVAPFVHGGVWLPGDLSHCVALAANARLLITLYLSPPPPATEEFGGWSLQWKCNSEHSILITSMEISCVQRDA